MGVGAFHLRVSTFSPSTPPLSYVKIYYHLSSLPFIFLGLVCHRTDCGLVFMKMMMKLFSYGLMRLATNGFPQGSSYLLT